MPTPDTEQRRRFGCFFAVLAVTILMIALGVFSFWVSISGVEFSPNNFQSRTFSYSRIPGTRIRVSPTKLGGGSAVASTDILKHLPTLNRPQEWHVSSISGAVIEKHAANILIEALRQRDADGLDAWGQWSTRHPNKAAIFWPLVQQVALQRLYACVPELLELAESTTDPAALEKNVLDALAQAVVEQLERSTEDAQSTELLNWMASLPVKDAGNVAWFEKRKEEVRRTRGPLSP